MKRRSDKTHLCEIFHIISDDIIDIGGYICAFQQDEANHKEFGGCNCGEWFTAHGIDENIGHPRNEKNLELMMKLREVFKEWYYNGHTNVLACLRYQFLYPQEGCRCP